jgi:hypothetical protein
LQSNSAGLSACRSDSRITLWHSLRNTKLGGEPRGQAEDPKAAALRETRSLNPRPEAVTDSRFASPGAAGFFDPRDLAQVKYEMVRAVRVEKMPVTAAAAGFGLSRQT